jgi:hypothetical protein
MPYSDSYTIYRNRIPARPAIELRCRECGVPVDLVLRMDREVICRPCLVAIASRNERERIERVWGKARVDDEPEPTKTERRWPTPKPAKPKAKPKPKTKPKAKPKAKKPKEKPTAWDRILDPVLLDA